MEGDKEGGMRRKREEEERGGREGGWGREEEERREERRERGRGREGGTDTSLFQYQKSLSSLGTSVFSTVFSISFPCVSVSGCDESCGVSRPHVHQQALPEIQACTAAEEGQTWLVELRHHCCAGGGRQEEDQNVVLETHEATQVRHRSCDHACDNWSDQHVTCM